MSNKWVRIILIGVSAALVLCLLLGAGIFVVRWTSRSTGRPIELVRQIFGDFAGHGAVGSIQTIKDQTITVLQPDGTTEIVLVNPQTHIEQNRKRITLADLKINDRIAVVGTPDSQGEISARWIHILKPAESASTQATPTPTQAK